MGSEVKVTQSCPTLSNPMYHTVCGILQTRILKWVAISNSRGSFQPRDQTQVSHIAGRFFTSWATREVPAYLRLLIFLMAVLIPAWASSTSCHGWDILINFWRLWGSAGDRISRDGTQDSHTAGGFFTSWATREALLFQFSSAQFSHSVVSNSLWPHESQHARPPCPSPTPRVYSSSCPSSRWFPSCSHETILVSRFMKQHETISCMAEWNNSVALERGPGSASRDTHNKIFEFFTELKPSTNGRCQHSSF